MKTIIKTGIALILLMFCIAANAQTKESFIRKGNRNFNKGNYAGLGSGLHYISHTHKDENSRPDRGPFVEAVPLYADYVHYFFFGKSQFSFYLGMEAGGTYEIAEPTCNLYSHHRLRPWLNGKFGFDAGITRDIGITLGVNLIAVPTGGDSEYMLAPAIGLRF